MAKVSRPVVYTAVAAVAVYAVFLNTQPATPTTRRLVRVTRPAQAAAPGGLLPADLSAHFPRYTGGARDPFAPGIVLARPRTAASAARPDTGQAGWTLTGINSVNGVTSALLENDATGESVFVQPGDRWNGLRVVAIKSDRVLFLDALGHQDSLAFAQPPDDGTGAAGGPVAPRLPSAATAQSLAPYPVTPLPVSPLSPSPASLPALPPLSETEPAPALPPSSEAEPAAPDDNAPPPGPSNDQQ